MHTKIKHYVAIMSFFLWLPFILNACGGGGSSLSSYSPPAEETLPINGIATKGLIKGASVSAYLLDKNAKIDESNPLNSKPAITDTSGNYKLNLPKTTEPIVIIVTGSTNSSYTSEITGKTVQFTASEKLRSVIPNALQATHITVSPLTQAAYDRLVFVKQNNPTAEIASAIDAANSFVAKQNGLNDILAAPDQNYSAVLTVLQGIIEATPSGTTQTLATLMNNAVTTNSGLTAYQSAVQTAISALPTAVASTIITQTAAMQTAVVNAPAPATIPPVAIETIAPFAPKNLKATFPSVAGIPVTLTWDASTPGTGSTATITGYEIYRNNALLDTTTVLTYEDKTAVLDTAYIYKVKSINSNKIYSDFSFAVNVTPIANALLAIPITVTSSGSIQ